MKLVQRSNNHYILYNNSNVKSKEFTIYLPTLSINDVAHSEVKYYNSKENKKYYKRIIGYGGKKIETAEYIKVIPIHEIKNIIKTKPHSYIDNDTDYPIWKVEFNEFGELILYNKFLK